MRIPIFGRKEVFINSSPEAMGKRRSSLVGTGQSSFPVLSTIYPPGRLLFLLIKNGRAVNGPPLFDFPPAKKGHHFADLIEN
jgi:hypothetical protein